MTVPKNPRKPPRPLTREPDDIHMVQSPLWRFHRIAGTHASRWDELREHGPIPEMRWDPHPPPRGDHPGIGVSYASPFIETAVAEKFQGQRVVYLTADQALTGWMPTRPLALLGLAGEWELRNGASASLGAQPKSVCRAWAQTIHETWPDLDGLLVKSTMTGRSSVVLFSPAADSFPDYPLLSTPLDQWQASSIIIPIAKRYGWPVAR